MISPSRNRKSHRSDSKIRTKYGRLIEVLRQGHFSGSVPPISLRNIVEWWPRSKRASTWNCRPQCRRQKRSRVWSEKGNKMKCWKSDPTKRVWNEASSTHIVLLKNFESFGDVAEKIREKKIPGDFLSLFFLKEKIWMKKRMEHERSEQLTRRDAAGSSPFQRPDKNVSNKTIRIRFFKKGKRKLFPMKFIPMKFIPIKILIKMPKNRMGEKSERTIFDPVISSTSAARVTPLRRSWNKSSIRRGLFTCNTVESYWLYTHMHKF